jgi:hypothetical protein
MKRLLDAGEDAPAAVRAKALVVAGAYALWLPDWERARPLLEQGLALYREAGDAHGAARALMFLGHGQFGAPTVPRVARIAEAFEAFRACGDRGWEALCLFCGAILDSDMSRAEQVLEQALAINRDIGFGSGVAMTLGRLAATVWARDGAERAEPLTQEALAHRWALRDKFGTAEQMLDLAVMATELGQARRAARLLGAAEGFHRALGKNVHGGQRDQADRAEAGVRAELGDAAFEEAREAGRALPFDRAVAEALGLAEPDDGHDAATDA